MMSDASPHVATKTRHVPRLILGARCYVLTYLVLLVVELEVVFVLVRFFDVDLDPKVMVWVLPAVIPLPTAALVVAMCRRQLDSFRLDPWPLWAVSAVLMFAFWAGGYFLVGLLTSPERVMVLPEPMERFDKFIPFDVAFVLPYIGVFPMFLLPFFAVRTRRELYRMVLGNLVMLTVSYVIFVIVPVAFPRPSIPSNANTFAAWVMGVVQGQDPPWNCLPSTHCAVALLSALHLLESRRHLGIWAMATAFLIGVSTMYTKQHYLVDVLSGFALAAAVFGLLRWVWTNPQVLPQLARNYLERASTDDQGPAKAGDP